MFRCAGFRRHSKTFIRFASQHLHGAMPRPIRARGWLACRRRRLAPFELVVAAGGRRPEGTCKRSLQAVRSTEWFGRRGTHPVPPVKARLMPLVLAGMYVAKRGVLLVDQLIGEGNGTRAHLLSIRDCERRHRCNAVE